jgi:UDP-3-O-[3-hydroxymyristoyl] glucosamine N-acyltransferase
MKINDLTKLLEISTFVINNPEAFITTVKQATAPGIDESTIVWVSEKNSDLLLSLSNGTVICSNNTPPSYFNTKCNYLLVNNPRATFRVLLQKVFVKEPQPFISPTSFIHPSVILGDHITVGHNVVIEEKCIIGDNTVIGHNTVLFKNTIVGSDVKIGANNSIGGVGFGYEQSETGNYELIPHIGNVVIKDSVEIGNNTTIDRGVIGSTLIESHVKIDNLVHIAHGVTIGENSLIIANSMIAGSVKIGKNTWVSPSTSVLNNKTIGANSVIGMGAVVLKDVEPKSVIVGNPGRRLQK